MDVPFQKNKPFFLISHLQGENASEETHSLSFIPLAPFVFSEPIHHNKILPTNKVP